jgi:two-component system OmpR family response regulator
MAVLVHDPIQEATLQLAKQVQGSYASGTPCGLILVPCTNMNQKVLDQLQAFVGKHEPEGSVHCFYLDRNGLLGMVLEDQKLAGTHYTSLVMKEFLDGQGLLEGQMVVASFPECGEMTEHSLSQLLQTVTQVKGGSRDIQLFMNQGNREGITSILVADPDEVSRAFVKLRLEMKGYQVDEAKDGMEALEKYEQSLPDLVITELNLPILDGYQFIDRIRRSQSNQGEVIVLTDIQLPKSMDRAFELGASDYVTKPFSISELEWRIKKLGARYLN